MTAPTPDPQDATATESPTPERRLHPLSWLFVLIQQLKQFIVPLLVLLFVGRGDRNDLWSIVAICILGAMSIWQYYTYRFRIDRDSLQIRSGMFQRSLRQIPFARIHNVALHQSLLHRIFGVAEVRLESAGGIKPEAEMRVLKLEDALALEALVRRRRGAAAADAGIEHEAHVALHTLSFGDLIRIGVISNRGMIVVGGAMAVLTQISPDLVSKVVESWGRMLFGFVDDYGRGHEALAMILMILGFVALMRLFSVLIAILQYSGFRLEEHGRRLTLERGLLTRLRTSTPRRRIQSWTLREGMLHRLFRRRTLEVSTAVLDNGSHNQPRSLREIAPVATPERCDELIRYLVPQVRWPLYEWRPLHRSTAPRLFWPQLLMTLGVGAVAYLQFGALGLTLVLLWLPWAAYFAWQHARHAGYSIDEHLIASHSGWWTRKWRFAEIGKLQAIRFGRSPLDRRFGTATLLIDIAGGNALAEPLRLRFVPVDEARALHARLAREIARRQLHW